MPQTAADARFFRQTDEFFNFGKALFSVSKAVVLDDGLDLLQRLIAFRYFHEYFPVSFHYFVLIVLIGTDIDIVPLVYGIVTDEKGGGLPRRRANFQEGKNMKNAIENLFCGNIAPSEQMRPPPEHRRKTRLFADAADGLAAKLPETLRDEFQKVLSSHAEIFSIEVTQAFVEGFRLGVCLVTEALYGGEKED